MIVGRYFSFSLSLSLSEESLGGGEGGEGGVTEVNGLLEESLRLRSHAVLVLFQIVLPPASSGQSEKCFVARGGITSNRRCWLYCQRRPCNLVCVERIRHIITHIRHIITSNGRCWLYCQRRPCNLVCVHVHLYVCMYIRMYVWLCVCV